jgi:predicted nuclease of predicted toxin-antitoxin system
VRFLLDENVPSVFEELLDAEGHDIVSVKAVNPGIDDQQVWKLANELDPICVTFDKDFGLIAKTAGVTAKTGIILLRLNQGSLRDRALRLVDALSKHDQWVGHLAVVDQENVRFRKFGGAAKPSG